MVLEKINEQMRNMMDKKVGLGRNVDDWDYRKYQNSIELVTKLHHDVDDESKMYQYIPERELIEMQKKGFEDNHAELIEENTDLRKYGKVIQSGVNGFIRIISEKVKELHADPAIIDLIISERDKMSDQLRQRL